MLCGWGFVNRQTEPVIIDKLGLGLRLVGNAGSRTRRLAVS